MVENAGSPLPPLPLPEPAMGKAAYDEERRLRLAFDARCADNYARYRQSRREPGLDYLPIKLDIENVSRCNFRCVMCQVSEWPKGQRAEDLKLADFRRLIDEQYGLVEIKLQGLGEVLLGAPDFFDMIRYARDRHIWVRTVTNASLLHLKDNCTRLLDSDPNEVQISVDGASKAVFESIRHGSRFERVMDNCRLINAACRERGLRRTKMWTVLQQANLAEMEALVDLAHELGFASMVFSLDVTAWGSPDMGQRITGSRVHDQVTPERAQAAVARGNRLGLDVAFWNIAAKFDWARPETLCPWPFERAFVASDLRVVPCCIIGNPDVYDLGAVTDKGALTELWHSETYGAFRQSHIDGTPPVVCHNCYRRPEAP